MTGIIKVDTIQNNGGTTGLTIDSGGRVLMPARPMFHCDRTGLSRINSSAQVVDWTEQLDVGGNFASNQFTAPIAGNYYFQFNMLILVNGSSNVDFRLRKNSSGTLAIGYAADNNGANWHMQTVSGIFALAASDTVEVYVGSTAQFHEGQYSQFQGFLVG